MAKFQRPNLPNLEQAPEATAINQLGSTISNIPLLYAQYQQQKMEQDIKNKQLKIQQDTFSKEYGRGLPAPSGPETPEQQQDRLGLKPYAGLHPNSSEKGVPYSIEAELISQFRNGKIGSLEEVMKQYKDRLFPKVVDDPLGRPNVLTSEGPKPVFGDEAGSGPQNAMLQLRTATPKLADRFDKILDEAYPQNNQLLKQSVEAATSAAQVKSILNDPNPSSVGLNSLGFHFARMSGSNSQLSDAEREQFAGPMALIDRVVNKGYKLVVGDLSPQMRDDLNKLGNALEAKSRKQADLLLGAQKRRAKSTLGRFYNDGLGAAFPTVDELIVGAEDIQASIPQETPGPSTNSPALPKIGDTFNGAKVKNIKRVK